MKPVSCQRETRSEDQAVPQAEEGGERRRERGESGERCSRRQVQRERALCSRLLLRHLSHARGGKRGRTQCHQQSSSAQDKRQRVTAATGGAGFNVPREGQGGRRHLANVRAHEALHGGGDKVRAIPGSNALKCRGIWWQGRARGTKQGGTGDYDVDVAHRPRQRRLRAYHRDSSGVCRWRCGGRVGEDGVLDEGGEGQKQWG